MATTCATGSSSRRRRCCRATGRCYRFDPRAVTDGHSGLTLDSKPPSMPLEDYLYAETRYRMLTQSQPEEARRLLALAKADVQHAIASTSSSPATEDEHHELRLICRRRISDSSLANPLVLSASRRSARSLDNLEQMEDAGAARGRAAVAVRGADRARESRAGLFPGTRHLQLRRGADPLSRAAQVRAHARSNTSTSSTGPSRRWVFPSSPV